MPVVEESVVIARPPQEVLDFLVEFENIPVYDSSVMAATPVGDGPVGVGSRGRGTSKVLGRQFGLGGVFGKLADSLVERAQGRTVRANLETLAEWLAEHPRT